MAKPRKKWVVAVVAALAERGLTIKELADNVNRRYDVVRQVLYKDNMPAVRKEICDYLGLDLERLMEDEQTGID